MNESNKKQMVSLVVPCYNECEVFPHLRTALADIADALCAEFRVEMILIDDGSQDSTWAQICAFSEQDSRVRGASLARNFGHQLALTCGYDLAQGDAIVSLDADLQDPPEVVFAMVEKWKQGYDIVHVVRAQREGESCFKLWTASLFYRFIRFLGASHVKADTGDFRLMSQRSMEALRQMHEYHRFIRGMVGWVGFRTTEISYNRKPRKAGETKYPLRKMLHFATDAIVSFSTIPLKASFVTALLLSMIIFGYLAIATIKYLFFGSSLVPGWTSLILAIVSLGAMNLICIGILGEYVGRIYEQTKHRPLYIVQDAVGKESPVRIEK